MQSLTYKWIIRCTNNFVGFYHKENKQWNKFIYLNCKMDILLKAAASIIFLTNIHISLKRERLYDVLPERRMISAETVIDLAEK